MLPVPVSSTFEPSFINPFFNVERAYNQHQGPDDKDIGRIYRWRTICTCVVDCIIIQGVRGDVLEITPTHILLGEVGGTVGGEEASNRGILIPNAVLFDQMVTNYAVSDETKYILDEVPVRVSYDSDYSLAEKTLIACAREATKEIIEETRKDPEVRAEFFESGFIMRLRYQSIAVDRQKISTQIVAKVVEAFGKSDQIGFAYPHSAIEYKLSEVASLPPMHKEVPPNQEVDLK